MYPGQFNVHITNQNVMISPHQNDYQHQPYILRLRNKQVLLGQIQQAKEALTDSYLSQTSDLSQNLSIKSKLQELENLSLKKQNLFLSQEIEQQQKELSKLCKLNPNHLVPIINKQKQTSLTDQEIQDLQYPNGLDTKRAQSIRYQYSSKYDNQSDSTSYKQTHRNYKQNRIQKRNSREFQNQQKQFLCLQIPDVRNQPTFRESKLQYRAKRFHLHISRLKVLFLFIRAYIRWTKNYRYYYIMKSTNLSVSIERQKRNQYIYQLKQIQQKYKRCLETIANQNVYLKNLNLFVLICKLIIKQWISNIIDPLIKSFSTNQFIQQSIENQNNPNSASSIQNRQHQFIQLTNQIMKNIEKFTYKDQIPEIIQSSLFLSLFKKQNIKAPIFVSKRTKYYTKNTIKIGDNQEKLIIAFDRQFKSYGLSKYSPQNAQYKSKKLFYYKFMILAILGIFQIIFQDCFSELKQYDEPSTDLFQRRIKISKSQDISIITDSNIDQQQSLIYGLQNRQDFQNIMEKNEKWFLEICTKFSKILNNLHSIL